MEERAADSHATEGIRGDLARDTDRPTGQVPSETEIELERRAIAVGLGIIWVAIYEETGGKPSNKYPPVADRLSRCLDQFGRTPDGIAAELLSDFIKSWVDPMGVWSAREPTEATAQSALEDACGQLDEYLLSKHQKPKV
jgi:hypothetical protein